MSTGDAGLIDTVKRASKEARRASRHRREATIIAAGRGILENPEVKKLLALKPHPSQSFADEGKSLLDYVNFMFDAAGNKGKMQTVELLCKFQGVKATGDDESDYEIWQRQIRRQSEAKAERARIENADLIAALESRPESDFIRSMLEKLRSVSLGELSDRQYQIIADIFARSFGSPRSRKYNEALSGLAERRRESRAD